MPDGWAWERLGNITTIARGGSPRPIKSYLTTELDGVNWIKIGDTEKNGKYIFSTKEKIKPEGIAKSRYVKSGDFLLTNSMSFGRPYILKTDGCIHDGWLMIGNTEIVFNQDYLYYALSSDFMYNMLSVLAGGSTVDNLNSDLVKSLLFPIPPMQEQIIIANKAESLMEIVDTINNNEKELLKNIKSIKSKILDLAIRGKLVPQDPNDEPASVLLERIRAEKEELIKQGKIKRDKKESVIFKGDDNSYYEKIGDEITCIDDELPFEIPDSWCWARLSSFTEVIMGSSPRSQDICSDSNYTEFHQGKINFSDCLLKESNQYTKNISKVAPKNSVLLCVRAPVGEVNITDREICIGRGLSSIHAYDKIQNNFLFYWLKTQKRVLVNKSTGSTFSAITIDTVKNILLPIPPINEQLRITQKILDLNRNIESIKANLR